MLLHFKEYGQGEPLIILHGLFGTLDNWQTLARKWAAHYTVFCLDLRNHGHSPFAPSHTYRDLADDLAEFMDAHWIQRTHLLGHSMGGKAALQFALDNNDRIDKLIIADVAPKAYINKHQTVFDALFAVDFKLQTHREDVQKVLDEKMPNDPATLQFLLKNLTRNPETMALQWKMNLPVLHQFYPEIAGNITSEVNAICDRPTLFLRGETSNYIEKADEDEIKKIILNARFQTISNAGHWLHAENPTDFSAAVLHFLAEK